jgi:lipoprotein-anchoring transpeptidase ErfK/SrfK
MNAFNRFTKIAAAALLSASLFGATLSGAAFANTTLYDDAGQADEMAAEAYGFKRGTLVQFSTSKPKGSIVIVSKTNKLYYVLGNGMAIQFRVATARKGFGWSGSHKVSMKVEWPSWRPPVEMRQRHPELPTFMKGGSKNPLGARAMYLGSSIYRIHGTNEPKSIGRSASSGCIRMLNADVTELYQHVRVGALVVVM